MSTTLGALVALAAASTACTLVPTSGDGGAEGGAGDAATMRVGDQCTEVVTEFCLQAIDRCGIAMSLGDCVAGEMPNCCVGGACNGASAAPANAVASCKATIRAEDCNAIVNGQLGGPCSSLLQR